MTMKNYLNELPPELILLLSPSLSTASLNALASTSRRTHGILQPELESRITPELGQKLLFWASGCNTHLVRKLLSPPHSIHPPCDGALLAAAQLGNIETAKLLLDAGANPAASWDQEEYQPLHLAALNKDLPMMKLLLDHGAPVDDNFGCDGCSENALHYACSLGDMQMIKLLLEHGQADLEASGHYGTPLGFAVHRRNIEVVKFLLEKGANANVTVPLFVLLDGGPPLPHQASLLYIALDLRHPTVDRRRRRARLRLKSRAEEKTPVRWEGLPLGKERKELMALLMAHGATKDGAMLTMTQYLDSLAEAAVYSEEGYLQVIAAMFKEAEEAILEGKEI
ncbi:ANK-REP-region domain-containing protein [Favolaschia claudopus]|uniref:ANK-REP-region domain-containing protein n=1 Tax=Favolaschia claudopus TaxID=2862362 RepID=A0AAW0BDV4_9AGAR